MSDEGIKLNDIFFDKTERNKNICTGKSGMYLTYQQRVVALGTNAEPTKDDQVVITDKTGKVLYDEVNPQLSLALRTFFEDYKLVKNENRNM